MKLKIILSLTTLFAFISLDDLKADDAYNGSSRANSRAEQEKNKGSNASFDKRLPPVLPGEVLNDGQGKTKVWSTAGAVSVGAPNSPGNPPMAPLPPYSPEMEKYNPGYQNNNGNLGVIIDRRGNGK